MHWQAGFAWSIAQSINILKAHGQSARESYLLNGYALPLGRAAQGMPKRVAPARIACLDVNLQKTKMQMGVQVLVTDPRELEKIRQRLVHHLLRFLIACFWIYGFCITNVDTIHSSFFDILIGSDMLWPRMMNMAITFLFIWF